MPGPDPTTATAPTRRSSTRRRRHRVSRAVVALAVSGSLVIAASALPASGSARPSDDAVDLASSPHQDASGAGRAQAASVPVYPGPLRVRQPDGSRVTVVAGVTRRHTATGALAATPWSRTRRESGGTPSP